MIRKLIAAGSVVAVAVVALMVMTIGSGTQSAEAHVQAIAAPGSVTPTLVGVANIRVFAQDGHGDVHITVSAGAFVDCDYEDFTPCDVDNGVPNDTVWSSGDVDDSAPAIGSGDVDTIDLDWVFPENFDGNAILITACQADQNCPEQAMTKTMQVVGAPAEVTIFAGRNYTTESTSCQQTQVYVIAAEEYSFNNPTTFDNNRAIICADVRDSAGHVIGNEQVLFTTTDGCFSDTNSTTEVNNTGSNSLAFARLESCGTGNSGDVATITAQAGGVFSNAIQVEFGGDPASCMMVITPESLDIGDTGEAVVTFIDELGNKVPDGIVVNFTEVSSGNSSGNVDLNSALDDTTDSMAGVGFIAAISGDVVIGANIESTALTGDASCSETITLSGDVHGHPDECIVDGVEDPDFILSGFPPPGGNYEWGTFEFCGGSYDALLEASGCDADEAVFFYNTPDGDFVAWIPSAPDSVNEDIFEIFPPEHGGIDPNTIFTAACSANEGEA